MTSHGGSYEKIVRQVEEARAAREAKLAPPAAAAAAPPPAAATAVPLSDAVKAGIAAGHINITSTATDRMDLTGTSKVEAERHEALLTMLERKRAARTLAVPTDDHEVKMTLRSFGQPICLFGEGPGDRRDRLTQYMQERDLTTAATSGMTEEQTKRSKEETAEVWYHEGPPELLDARRWIARDSLLRARERLKDARLQLSHPDRTRHARRTRQQNDLREFTIVSSQIGDLRPLSHCAFSPEGSVLAVASWSGLVKLWSMPACDELMAFRGHTDRVSGIAWHPQALRGQTETALQLASCGIDGYIHLYNRTQDTPIKTLPNLGDRVGRVAFHPTGRFLASTCFDNSWRMFDLEGGLEILHQEGHSRGVYDVGFHPDGSLAGTTSLDATGRIWDLRTGKNIMVMQGHVKQVLSISFSPNGYHVATGSDDNSVRIWDLRTSGCVYVLPAHNNLVSQVKYHESNNFLVTSSYDETARIWTAPDCAPLKILKGHDGKVTSVDVNPDVTIAATVSWDRTIKLWGKE